MKRGRGMNAPVSLSIHFGSALPKTEYHEAIHFTDKQIKTMERDGMYEYEMETCHKICRL